jgi:hypothetical protein
MLLSLFFDVAVAMGPHVALCFQDARDRAAAPSGWPTHFADGTPVPLPAVLGSAERYRRLRAEIPLSGPSVSLEVAARAHRWE